MRTALLDLDLEQFEDLLKEAGIGRYRARQVFKWIFSKGTSDFSRMTDLPSALREQLSSGFRILSSEIQRARKSRDGTTKLLLKLHDSRRVEAVCIPEGKSATACISSQVGCPVRCVFCASGTSGFTRDLSSGEILEELLHLAAVPPRRIDHVVFMGTGEPLRNLDNVTRAIRFITARYGFGLSARRITVSTVGDIAGIRRLASIAPEVNLAISLHAPDDETRRKLVPGMRNVPVSRIVGAARAHFIETGRRVSFEYVLVRDINDSREHARELAQLLRRFPVFVNLIPLNPVPGRKLEPPPPARVKQFLSVLRTRQIPAAARRRRGADIEAACGQLSAKTARRARRQHGA